MLMPLLLSCTTATVLVCLVACLDEIMRPYWGHSFSFARALLVVFAVISGLYQIAMIVHLPCIFSVVDGSALLLCVLFFKPILRRMRVYARALVIDPLQHREWSTGLFFLLLVYVGCVAMFSVPGWEWDSMIFHLPRAFLYLNEHTIFTTHYSDPRQVTWPMGGDLLFYLFTRYGETTGVGWISFLFFIGILATLHEAIQQQATTAMARTMTFVAGSTPILVYSASSVKGDLLPIFCTMTMWLFFQSFRATRRRSDLYCIALTFAFGLTCKFTFVFAGSISLLAFLILEIMDRRPMHLVGPPLPWPLFVLFVLLCLLLSQAHLYVFNWMTYGHIVGPTMGLLKPQGVIAIWQSLTKYTLSLVDFVLPLSSRGIPFIDTALCHLYDQTIGRLTNDHFVFKYFPQEMNASFGPFIFLIALIGIYRTCFTKSSPLHRVFAFFAVTYMCAIASQIYWPDTITNSRYFGPPLIASLALLPSVYGHRLLRRHTLLRWSCIALLLFCNVFNFAKPLVAYDPKAIPWYTYALTNRDLLYKEKHFFDDRIAIYSRTIQPDDRILILGRHNVWMYPYYQHAPRHRIQLMLYNNLSRAWVEDHAAGYDLIICEHADCVHDLDDSPSLQAVWHSAPDLPRPAAFYRRTP